MRLTDERDPFVVFFCAVKLQKYILGKRGKERLNPECYVSAASDVIKLHNGKGFKVGREIIPIEQSMLHFVVFTELLLLYTQEQINSQPADGKPLSLGLFEELAFFTGLFGVNDGVAWIMALAALADREPAKLVGVQQLVSKLLKAQGLMRLEGAALSDTLAAYANEQKILCVKPV